MNQIQKFASGVLLVTAHLMVGNLYAADPCEQSSTMPSGGTTVTSNGIRDMGNGFNYELWRDGSSGSLTYIGGSSDCAFKASWNNSGDFLARVGFYYGGSNSKTYKDLGGDIHAAYKFSRTGTAGSYSYIGIYGWCNSPQIEYYIVEDSWNGMGTPYNTSKVGSYTVDGATYNLYKGTRVNQPSITGTSTFTQVFAVRSSARTCGEISISEHFRNWESNGITMGSLYDCKILCEAGGGSGSIEFPYATMWIGDSESSSSSELPTEEQAPYKDVIAIPGIVEAENYDKGGPSVSYYDTDNTNEGGEYREDGVDVVAANSGYAIGYTTADEWLEYSVNVAEAGKYDVTAYAANGSTNIGVDLYIDDAKVASLSGSQTSDWDTYSKVTGTTSSLSAGEHILKIKFTTAYNNIDYIQFTKEGESSSDSGSDSGSGSGSESGAATSPISGNFFDENGAYYGPSCENDGTQGTGAYYTGDYTSPFKTYLGKTDAEIQSKLDQLWQHYFVDSNSKVYYDKGSEAYIYDTGNQDVRSEGMSYGMMIAVQTNHKTEFDKLWAFAKNHMWHKSGGNWDGYFSWQCGTDGSVKDQNCAPDGEMYFTMALLFAANRWNDESYMNDAQYVLKGMWKGSNASLFNENYKVVTFQPVNCSDFSDPSYDLPAFVDLFSRWSTTNNSTWSQAATATRDHLYKSSNTSSGLFSDYNNFDGTPKSVSYNSNSTKYMYDAMRCAMNYGMDYYLFGKDATRQTEMAKRIIDFFEKDGYTHARFNWDGSNGSESYTLGETGANAVACYALMNDASYSSKVKTNLNKAWNATLATGTYRYYDGLVHYLSMLHLCGSFKIWKPTPTQETKSVEGIGQVEYQGVTYTSDTTIVAYEDCQLYNVNIDIEVTGVDNELANNKGIQLVPNPSNGNFSLICSEDVVKVEILNAVGQVVYREAGSTNLSTGLPAGIYILKAYTENGECFVKKMQVR